MTVFLHELKRGKLALIIWTAAISFMLVVTVLLFPEMKPQMSQMENFMSDMGSFSSAFGMDKMNFGKFSDYFAIECGNVLGLGGALFAAIISVSMLSKEEKEHTCEFLYTHPISRTKIVFEKLFSLIVQIFILNLTTALNSLSAILIIDEDVDFSILLLHFLSFLILELEITMICFCISSFLRSGLGFGIGISIGMYFLNIISNITEDAKFLKYLTPFAYTEGSEILQNKSLPMEYIAVGIVISVISILLAFFKTRTKDFSN